MLTQSWGYRLALQFQDNASPTVFVPLTLNLYFALISLVILYLLRCFTCFCFTMPSEKRHSTYSPLDNEERAQRSSSSTEVNDEHNDNVSIPILRWEQRHSVVWQMWHRWSNSVWFHAIFMTANLLLFGIAIYANRNFSYTCRQSAKYDSCTVIFFPFA